MCPKGYIVVVEAPDCCKRSLEEVKSACRRLTDWTSCPENMARFRLSFSANMNLKIMVTGGILISWTHDKMQDW